MEPAYLVHAANHKYISRKMVNGQWVYTYPSDTKTGYDRARESAAVQSKAYAARTRQDAARNKAATQSSENARRVRSDNAKNDIANRQTTKSRFESFAKSKKEHESNRRNVASDAGKNAAASKSVNASAKLRAEKGRAAAEKSMSAKKHAYSVRTKEDAGKNAAVSKARNNSGKAATYNRASAPKSETDKLAAKNQARHANNETRETREKKQAMRTEYGKRRANRVLSKKRSVTVQQAKGTIKERVKRFVQNFNASYGRHDTQQFRRNTKLQR